MAEFDYSGNELESFASAVNWKAYWSREIKPFLGENILEIGAGIGATAKTLNHKNYETWVGLEPDKGMCTIIEKGKKEGVLPEYLEIRNHTTFSLSPEEMFDTVLYIDVLEHIENDKEELARVERNLIKGGHIIIVSPAHNFLYTEFDKKIGHFRRYNKKSLLSAIPGGLKIKKMRYLDSVGLLASLGNKLLLRSDTPTYSQIQLWDRLMVRASLLVDIMLGYKVGKSIVCVLEKPAASPREV